jgi:hypothetical protein
VVVLTPQPCHAGATVAIFEGHVLSALGVANPSAEFSYSALTCAVRLRLLLLLLLLLFLWSHLQLGWRGAEQC